jgi:hypothetical protein
MRKNFSRLATRQLFTIRISWSILLLTFPGKLIFRKRDNPKRRKIHHGQEKSSEESCVQEEVEIEGKEEVVLGSAS